MQEPHEQLPSSHHCSTCCPSPGTCLPHAPCSVFLTELRTFCETDCLLFLYCTSLPTSTAQGSSAWVHSVRPSGCLEQNISSFQVHTDQLGPGTLIQLVGAHQRPVSLTSSPVTLVALLWGPLLEQQGPG